MIASFFQSLSRHGVEYLLISGQATVLYGAATFSEDIDLWIHPTEENSARFLRALRERGGTYYKLTPPFQPRYLTGGHGFHFVVPAGSDADAFVDVMGVPPRVGGFRSALGEACVMDTEWGQLPTIGLQSLVELKKTQRLEDYPIISKLALAWFGRPECAHAAQDYAWALENLFTLPELRLFFEEHPAAMQAISSEKEFVPGLSEFGRQLRHDSEVADELANLVNRGLQRRIADLQQADRRYWREIIAELRQLRSRGELVPEGSAV